MRTISPKTGGLTWLTWQPKTQAEVLERSKRPMEIELILNSLPILESFVDLFERLA